MSSSHFHVVHPNQNGSEMKVLRRSGQRVRAPKAPVALGTTRTKENVQGSMADLGLRPDGAIIEVQTPNFRHLMGF